MMENTENSVKRFKSSYVYFFLQFFYNKHKVMFMSMNVIL